jgi:hypothetical protein
MIFRNQSGAQVETRYAEGWEVTSYTYTGHSTTAAPSLRLAHVALNSLRVSVDLSTIPNLRRPTSTPNRQTVNRKQRNSPTRLPKTAFTTRAPSTG